MGVMQLMFSYVTPVGRVVLPDGQNLDVEQVMVLSLLEMEDNRGWIRKLYGAEVFCEAFTEGFSWSPRCIPCHIRCRLWHTPGWRTAGR